MSRSGSSASRRARLADSLRTQLWPLPTAAVVVAVVLGAGLSRLDDRLDSKLPPGLTRLLFSGDAEAARSVLGAVAGSLITATSLTFSLTVVTLQLASSQFSPRLLRNFSRDRYVHATLALFLATFAYALTVLRSVRSGVGESVPQVAVTLAYLLTVASVLALVLFLAHLSREIRPETMLDKVRAEAEYTVRQLLPDRASTDPPPDLPVRPRDAAVLTARSSGFVTSIDVPALVAAAGAADAIVDVDRMTGTWVVAGTPLAFAWSPSGELAAETLDELARRVASAIGLDFERTETEDIGHGLRQLTDVAVKALSPGINDPTTATYSLGHSSALLCEMVGRRLGPAPVLDEQENLRVVIGRPDLDQLLELTVGQPRRYGAGDPDLMAALLALLRELAWVVERDEDRLAVRNQLDRLFATVAEQDFDQQERARLEVLGRLVEGALVGRW